MFAIKPGLKIEIQDFVGAQHKGVVVSVDEKEKYDGNMLISAYCTIQFDTGNTYTDMYVMQSNIIQE